MPRERLAAKSPVESIYEELERVNYLEQSQQLFNELSKGLKIDRDNLDECLIQQPEFYHKVGREYQNVATFRDGAKSARDLLQSSLDTKLRIEAEKLQRKPTDTSINRLIHGEEDF